MKTALLVVGLVALLALPGEALAAQPVIVREVQPYAYTLLAADNACGVDIEIAGETRITGHFFFDEAGHLDKLITKFDDSWTETGPGGTVFGHFSATRTTTDIVEDETSRTFVDTWHGLPIKLSAPGVGTIVRDAGNVALATTLVFNGPGPEDDEFTFVITFEHGPHPTLFGSALFNEDWVPEYCAVVAG